MSLTPEKLRELAASAEDTINYEFDRPMVAMSQEDVLAVADKLEKQLAALKVTHQTVLEIAHAQEVGANWWTHGENAMYQHIRMHVQRAFDAFKIVGEF